MLLHKPISLREKGPKENTDAQTFLEKERQSLFIATYKQAKNITSERAGSAVRTRVKLKKFFRIYYAIQ